MDRKKTMVVIKPSEVFYQGSKDPMKSSRMAISLGAYYDKLPIEVFGFLKISNPVGTVEKNNKVLPLYAKMVDDKRITDDFQIKLSISEMETVKDLLQYISTLMKEVPIMKAVTGNTDISYSVAIFELLNDYVKESVRNAKTIEDENTGKKQIVVDMPRFGANQSLTKTFNLIITDDGYVKFSLKDVTNKKTYSYTTSFKNVGQINSIISVLDGVIKSVSNPLTIQMMKDTKNLQEIYKTLEKTKTIDEMPIITEEDVIETEDIPADTIFIEENKKENVTEEKKEKSGFFSKKKLDNFSPSYSKKM